MELDPGVVRRFCVPLLSADLSEFFFFFYPPTYRLCYKFSSIYADWVGHDMMQEKLIWCAHLATHIPFFFHRE
jgi:hypothetical protein